MTAGPTPVPPAVSQAMAAPMLYHRAPAFSSSSTSGSWRSCPTSSRPRTRSSPSPPAGRGRWSPPPPTSCARAPRCSPAPRASSVSAGSSCATPTAAGPLARRAGLGRAPRPGRDRPAPERERGHRGRLRHAQRDLDRRRPRHPRRSPRSSAHTTRSSPSTPSRASARPSCARTSGASTSPSRARRRRSCARPASASPRSPSARSSTRRSKPGGRYYFDWGKNAKAQAQGQQRLHARGPAVRRPRHRARHDPRGRARGRPRPPRAAGPGHRAGAAARPRLFGDADERSTVVTAVELPDSIDGAKVPGSLRKLGITANGGQDQLKGRILRIAHCGYFGASTS